MRKFFYSAVMLALSYVSVGQTLQDNAVIPISVTLNSILRLNVTSGGNIQFVFNTMAQYNGGITGTDQTTTIFNVSSSRAYQVMMGAEGTDLFGVETGLSIPLAVIQYNLAKLVGPATATVTGAGPFALDERANDVSICANTTATAAVPDEYSILWNAGTAAAFRATNYPPDVYVTNVYLTLLPN